MSAIPLSDIQEKIERSIYESIRLELVDKGYEIDVANYTNDQAGQDQMEIDRKTIVTAMGFAIEVFNVGTYQARNTKKVPRIVMDAQMMLPGELGVDTTPTYNDDGEGGFDKERRPGVSSDFFLNIYLVANTVKQLRVLQSILALTVPRRGYVKPYTESNPIFSGNFFVENISYQDNPQTDEGIMEKIYRFKISDIYETECEELDTIVPISDITLDVKQK